MNIYDFAMNMEMQGKKCYEDLAASTTVPGFRTIFLGLAADEQKHYEVFRELKEGKPAGMADSQTLQQAKSVFAELVTVKEQVMRQLHEDLDAYRVGLKIEAETVKLYEDLAKQERNPDLARLFARLADEEKKHFNILDNVCDFVMRPKYYLEWREFSNLHEL